MKTIFRPAFWDTERESKWLNKMSNKGWALVRHFYVFYSFEKCEPSEYVYQAEMLEYFPGSPQGKEYMYFLANSGVECVATFFRWAIFRWKANDHPFEIYTDYDSRIKHCKRTALFTGTLAGLMILLTAFNLLAWINFSALYDYWHLIAAAMTFAGCGVMAFVAIKNIKKIKKLKREQEIYDTTDEEEQ